ncbi:unnamed protein product [Ilex paraguariensis]|uniref:Bifunctional inhibitor/plant lipid transfer protein/seed storage helical domain-containing protein n=1 Tax=Ilex paraguariensis TaxID=185542 RepID=A0ABC8TE53_9AQUA
MDENLGFWAILKREKMKASHIAVCAILVLLLAETQVSMAVTCTPTELNPCRSAITSSSPPTKLCCSKLKEQQPCLCQYLKNPNLKKYIDPAKARKVAAACGVPVPKC